MNRLSVLFRELKKIQDEIEAVIREGKESKEGIQKPLFASKVKAYRIKNNLSQEELAKKLGVGRLAIIRWENAKSLPSGLAMEKLVNAGIIEKRSK